MQQPDRTAASAVIPGAGTSAPANPDTAPLTRGQFERLRALGAATVYEAQGAKGALDGGIKPIDPDSRLVGRP